MEFLKKKTLVDTHKKSDSGFSFEHEDLNVSIVTDKDKKTYIRIYKKACSAEGNGRPVTTISDECYPIDDDKVVTVQNWKKVMLQNFDKRILLKFESYDGVN
ncbi:MAG: hypothetical protein K6F75_02960 [Butyrivibrio sp.]|nr:hypothetical protein [Butyrivibrio sp.]